MVEVQEAGIWMRCRGLAALALALWLAAGSTALWSQNGGTASSAAARKGTVLGSIRAVAGSELSVATDQGAVVAVQVASGTRLLQMEPGQTDLKSAAPIALGDLQVGDRVLAKGTSSADGATVQARLVVVMKQQDIAQRHRQQMLDWQRRGVGGLVRAVDPRAGTISIRVNAASGSRTVLLRTSPQTRFKRYPPDSVKWEETVASSFAEIHPGDQVRAKGTRSADGGEMAVEEIVAGRFRYLSGEILALDPAEGTLTVKDLRTKQAVTVAITRDSRMKRLPPEMAEALAKRWKAGKKPAYAAGGASKNGEGKPPEVDLNQMLARLPSIAAGNLRKGEAVMIVSTMGLEAAPNSSAARASKEKLPSVLTLLGGVEPLLRASPAGEQGESLLTPWSLASPPGGV